VEIFNLNEQSRVVTKWTEEIEWVVVNARGHSIIANIYKMCLAAEVYYILLEKKMRLLPKEGKN